MKKRQLVDKVHRIINPITRRVPGQMVLETKGRVSGQQRRTPIAGSAPTCSRFASI